MDEKTNHNFVAYKTIGGWNVTARANEIGELKARTEELELAFGKALSMMDSSQEEPPIEAYEEESQDHCARHNVTMKERDGKNGKFYSHYVGKFPDGSWCNGR
jgi:hypothetical protein